MWYVLAEKYIMFWNNRIQITQEDMTWGNELYKGYGYRLYSGRNSGKIVAVKVYEGDHAREVSLTHE